MICYHKKKLIHRTYDQVSKQLVHSLVISMKLISHKEGMNVAVKSMDLRGR